MDDVFRAVKVTDRVYWVGAVDWRLRHFHGYLTARGTTYNAYLVLADKMTLIDTVKAPFKKEMLDRIASIVDPKEIKYIVSNHSEMDHSGCLPDLMASLKPEKVFASMMGVKALKEHFHLDGVTRVKDGETLSLGNASLVFAETKMIHWPDSMFAYLPEDQLLFSQDGFGMHLASSERFDDEIDSSLLEYEGAKYFANIILPYAPLVTKLLERVAGLKWNMKFIAPDHGPVWRKDVDKILGLYAKWAAQKPAKKAVVAYDTMWQSTAMMARAISEGLEAGGLAVKVMPLDVCHRSDVMTELLCAGAFVVGSPTMNNQVYPTVADLLTYVRGLKPKNLVGAAFGSYGWSGEAIPQIIDVLKAMKVDVVADGLRVLYVPDEAVLVQCRALGADVAEKVRSNVG